MSAELIGVVGIIVLIALLFMRMWIGIAMLLVGILGYAYLEGFNSALMVIRTVPYGAIAYYPITAVPLFVLMGSIVSITEVSKDLFDTAYKWLGQLRGGLAMTSILACAGFAAISGSSVAGAVTMGKVALPEMKRYKYNEGLAAGCVASGGTLGLLIPPSLGFILYGVLTEQSVGKLFMAGIIPGISLALLLMGTVFLVTVFNPAYGPPGAKTCLKEKFVSLRKIWHVTTLFVLVLGGIYMGIFTPTEAGAIGAFGAIVITLIARRLTRKKLFEAFHETLLTTSMVLFLLIGAFVFMRFLSISKIAFVLSDFISELTFSKYAIFALIMVLYVILGMFLDIFSSIILTIPVLFPSIVKLGFDPIWFGVVMAIVMEMGVITPPVGLNVFALSGVSGVPLQTIFRGVLPFILAMIFFILLVTIFPGIALIVPNMM